MSSIPTTYNGIRFRSRLEAKWAYIFDRLGWEWDYEPFDLNGWIPDFVISKCGSLRKQIPYDSVKPLVVEIKPIVHTGNTESSAPDYVKKKIEKALDSPYFHKPYSIDAWDKWFAGLQYYPLILGTHPSHAWVCVPSWCWYQVGAHLWRNYDWDTGEIGFAYNPGFWPKNGRDIWHDATNKVQWRAPA
jgi:hypothetical protein